MKTAPRLYAITDNHLLPGDLLLTRVEQVLCGGCGWVQYRDKSNDNARRLFEATSLASLCRRFDAKLIVNDDPALALASGADGVHLGVEDMAISAARALLGPAAIIGATCHGSLALAQASVTAGADYVAFGRFFPSRTKPNAEPAPLALIAQAKHQLAVPVVVIGGINLGNATLLRDAGADCLAVCEGLFGDDRCEGNARELVRLMC